jgi:hypothetical protein|uniref:Uncharacterized protein n=2 Tax=Enterobacteriaceae TaxID=543 RepID=A0A2R4A7Q7_ECOLX|nr:hypothetical protein [Enterobacter cloacae]AVR60621.1 hypothetical protein [Escherichia coli]
MEDPSDSCHKYDAEASPNSISNADRDGLECEREEIERKPVASHNYNRRN